MGSDEALFNWERIGHYVRFALGAPRRHPFVALAILVAVIGGTALLVAVIPRTYYTEARILASRNLIMPALGNPTRSIPVDADAPTRAASETILRRDNLLVLMDQTNLLAAWEAERPLLFRAKDAVEKLFTGPVEEQEKRQALVYLLERRLRVSTGDGTISIEIEWPDPKMAYKLVSLAQQNFLETRHAIEVSTIAEAISILEGHAATARSRVDTSMAELMREREARRSPAPAAARARTRVGKAAPEVDPDVTNLKVMLVAKRRALQDLEEYRQRRLAELQAQLGEQSASYTPSHPVVQATTESIQSLQKDSPQLAQLRRDERDLMTQFTARGGSLRDLDVQRATSAAERVQLPAYAREGRRDQDESETVQYWRTQLDYALQKYESLVGRIDAARIELDTARAAFAYRYVVIRPAEISKKPTKPNIPLLMGMGVFAGIFLAFAGTTFLDWRRGILLEPWQVDSRAGVPVLAEFEKH
jgi:uncharacterized protein involved in exopolysaccharide biosynthesis